MAIEKNKNLSNTPKETLNKSSSKETPRSDDPYMLTEFDDGSLEFDFDPSESAESLENTGVVNISKEHYENLASKSIIDDEKRLNKIAEEVITNYEEDKLSRNEWLETVNTGLNLLGTKVEETNDPFPGACGAHHPLILESAVKFQAKASNELFSAKGPVKTAIIGTPTESKEAQAQRVRNHMNYQIMDEMEEYFDEQEQMLFYLPLVGSGFKKLYYDEVFDRPRSVFIPVDQLIVNYHATNLKTAPCITHVIQRSGNDLLRDMKVDMYRDVDLSKSTTTAQVSLLDQSNQIDEIMGFNPPPQDDSVYTILEQYVDMYIEEDSKSEEESDIASPYIITVELESSTVLSIRRNWQDDDESREKICPFTHYKFVPGMGFYGLGYIHLLGNLQMTLTSTMRSLVDSGMFANLQGGFVDKRLRVRNNDGPIAPGEFKEVEAGVELDKAIKTLPFKEPSLVLLQMYQFVEARGQKFADSTEQVVADSTNYGPVGTTLALLEESTKFFSGIHKRLHKAQKQEFKILASLNYEYLEESENFETIGNSFEISKADYDGTIDVIPVSDPNLNSQAQRLTVAEAIYTAALQKPDIHNIYEVSKYYYNAIGIDEDFVDKFLPPPEQPQELDPISDIMAAQSGKPIGAFPGQDHEAHVGVKSAFLQDPQSGGSPVMAPIAPIIQSNIQEHQILKFKESAQGTSEESGESIAIAQAAQQVAQQNQQIQELQAKGPDEARSKLAEAEVHRVMNESRKLEAEINDKSVQRTFDALKLELEKYKEDNKLLIAQMQESNKDTQSRMKEMSTLLKESMKIEQQAVAKTTTVDKE